MQVYQILTEKKPEYAVETASLASDLRFALEITNLKAVRIINRYFIEGISEKDFETVKKTVFYDPIIDIFHNSLPSFDENNEPVKVFAAEFLPGQFDQRADYCAQCIKILTGKDEITVHTSKIYAFCGDITTEDFKKIKSWILNPVESRETSLEKPDTLKQIFPVPGEIKTIDGFISFSDSQLKNFGIELKLAMDLSDLKFCQNYFRNDEKRDPTITEIRVLDTYWSDHCRHTTFLTELDIQIEDGDIKQSYNDYLELRTSLGRGLKPITLMDIATIGARALKKRGLLKSLDESDEINACSVKIKVDVDGKEKDWLLMFKNETHNHPTEIEPFGGASTCLGGAIRDPLSGRSYVYQAMRITGASDPLQKVSSALPGKLPQLKICRTAAAGYSSYGNQIGLSSGHLLEIYHSGYAAKRMELGALIGAAPAENVVRKKPSNGDVVILLGGRTGRDGIGGATSSSKSQSEDALLTCGADVQKGNPPEERKIVRLFRNPKAARLIKKCNDFGAGGVSVSVGELADGLLINLNKVTTKYDGLDGTEIAISESQERMSVVTSKKDADKFIKFAKDENLEAAVIAEVTKSPRLVMNWNKKTIVNLSRAFLNSNGSGKSAKANILTSNLKAQEVLKTKKLFTDINELESFAGSLNICSQKGLINRFDSTIGAATVMSPLGGKYQLTPAQVMAAKIPVLNGETTAASVFSFGFDPIVSSVSPYYGAVFAVVHSIAKIIAAGGSRKNCWLSFQEYFERLGDDPLRWGKPVSALLGALDAQLGLEIAAIGGKDSMSGSFGDIDVPPTLVSFAVSTAKTAAIISPEFKKDNRFVYLLKIPSSLFSKVDYAALRKFFDDTEKLIKSGQILSAWALGSGGTAEAIIKMCAGNRIGFTAEKDLNKEFGFNGFIIETAIEAFGNNHDCELLGRTTKDFILKTPSLETQLEKLLQIWESTLEPVYPLLLNQNGKTENFKYIDGSSANIQKTCSPIFKTKRPKFLIPVFPDTNSEYDIIKAAEKAGGEANPLIMRNLTSSCIEQSTIEFVKAAQTANIIFIPGGISGCDEPSGSGSLTAAFMRSARITDTIMEFLQKRDGLIGAIGSGFSALLKLGLLPYGEIYTDKNNLKTPSCTLAFNSIGRHQAVFVNAKIISNKSPWLSHLKSGDRFITPVSHGEGRFTADESLIKELAANGQIAMHYTDYEGNASQDISFNPGNSDYSVLGITSADGRIFGTNANTERLDKDLYKNIPGITKIDIFSGAVRYFG
ncbi:MAG: phosphoribosylformylglycinamidine synthase [Treponema sp.]|nr:phosphoribosylformylglycinamidine synthase [Treponema sp.]